MYISRNALIAAQQVYLSVLSDEKYLCWRIITNCGFHCCKSRKVEQCPRSYDPVNAEEHNRGLVQPEVEQDRCKISRKLCGNTPDSKVHGAKIPSGADRTHTGPILTPWTLLSGTFNGNQCFKLQSKCWINTALTANECEIKPCISDSIRGQHYSQHSW